MLTPKWRYRHDQKVTSIEQFQQVILDNRHWTTEDLSAQFDLEQMTPAALEVDEKQLALAIDRLARARDYHESVLIFGDYDVDGNGATAIMWLGLRALGIQARPFIPDRFRHGYGMSPRALEEICATDAPDLIITVDNGITAHEALSVCLSRHIDVIVTDHHQPESDRALPATALVHSSALAGAGVAWFLVYQAQLKLLDPATARDNALELLDLVALATIVDQVPLVGLNRRLVRAGMKCLRESQRPGITALCEGAGCAQKDVGVHEIGYLLGPRINALGRLKGSLDALRLLCTGKLPYARQLAADLTDINRHRQELTRDQLALAHGQVEARPLDKIIIVASDKFHEGIIGLVASKLVEEYSRPAIVINIGPDIAKGSARSIPGINITDFIRQFRADLLDVGGHEMAAGCSLAIEKVETVIQAMRERANQIISDEQLIPELAIEAETTLSVLFHPYLPSLFALLEPFGPGNEELTVSVTGRVASVKPIGKQGQHWRISLADEKRHYLAVLLWDAVHAGLFKPVVGHTLQVVGQLQLNQYQGKISPQIIAADWREVVAS